MPRLARGRAVTDRDSRPPTWLTIVALIARALAFATVAAILSDVFVRGHRRRTGVMEGVWGDRPLLAIGIALVNMARVVGLTLFESVRYRGGFARFFRTLSLLDTPAALIVNLLILILASPGRDGSLPEKGLCIWRRGSSERPGRRCRRRGSAAWGCRSSTAPPMRPRRGR